MRTLAVGDFAEDEKTAVAPLGDGRKRGFGKAFPVAFDGARLELQLLRAAQHLRSADGVAVLMRQLLRIDGDAVKAQQQYERELRRYRGAGAAIS